MPPTAGTVGHCGTSGLPVSLKTVTRYGDPPAVAGADTFGQDPAAIGLTDGTQTDVCQGRLIATVVPSGSGPTGAVRQREPCRHPGVSAEKAWLPAGQDCSRIPIPSWATRGLRAEAGGKRCVS